MSEPQVPFEEVLSELESQHQQTNKPRLNNPTRSVKPLRKKKR
jgi:hypothetical protein